MGKQSLPVHDPGGKKEKEIEKEHDKCFDIKYARRWE